MDLKIFDDNKKFWQNIKPLFSNKQNVLQKNIIVEKDTIISKNNVAEKLNNFFIESVENIEIEPSAPNCEDTSYEGSIHEIILKYERHPSILKIKECECGKHVRIY